MYRFFCPKSDLESPSFQLTNPKEIHHLCHVLRKKEGDSIEIFDGQGKKAVGTIQKTAKTSVSIQIAPCMTDDQPDPPVILACAIPKKAKFETIIEKCTELGVNEIIPMMTKRTEVRISAEKTKKKTERYQNVAINAVKQCGRSIIPVIHPVQSFSEALQLITPDMTALIPHLEGKRTFLPTLFQSLSRPAGFFALIGPEGDFTIEETQQAIAAGCQPVSLGENVLKVDTAAITVTALCRMHLIQNRLT